MRSKAGDVSLPDRLHGARIVLGVSGGIAAYKSADLTSKLVQAGADVDVVLTDGALHFIQPLTFNALTRRPVYSSVVEPWSAVQAGHVTLAEQAEVLLIAPATANTIARLAHGLVDDMLTAVALATRAPILIAPAMEHNMWHHPATQANLKLLQARGVIVIAPDAGRLASGANGDGRLAAIDVILAKVRQALQSDTTLAGKRIVVSAGGTQEAIDPVRYIGNRSSGRMGVEIARAAAARGAAVTLVAVQDVDVNVSGIDVVRVRSAREMESAIHDAIPGADAIVMAAAVADFRPVTESTQKIKKQPGQDGLTIELMRNPDIIAGIDQPGLVKIGFAAETQHLAEHAQQKLQDKGLAMIVANDAVATIGSLESEATLFFADRAPVHLPKAAKDVVADRIVDELVTLLGVQTDA
jgi:phosphopantothenoylcysteine decarboxylase/phosphopantothenate--cysteine ligase